MPERTPAEELELALVREFSTHFHGQIGRSRERAERRERVRQAIYFEQKMNDKFRGRDFNYAEAFRLAFGERLDRRAATRTLPDPDGDDDLEML